MEPCYFLTDYFQQNFLNVFDLVNEDGDLFIDIEDFNLSISQQEALDLLSKTFEVEGIGFFSFFNKMPHLFEKINLDINIKEQYSIVNLAPLLGLPGNNNIQELNELKSLFNLLKDIATQHPEQRFAIQLFREFDECGINIIGKNKDLESKFQQIIDNKISSSSILTSWFENQKIGIKNFYVQNDVLWATFDLANLINYEDRLEYYQKSNPTPQHKAFKHKIKK